jgi:hypothetical protein
VIRNTRLVSVELQRGGCLHLTWFYLIESLHGVTPLFLRLITNVSASSDVLNFGMTRFSRMTVARDSDAVNVRDFGSATPEAKTRRKYSLFLPWFPLFRIAEVL